MWATFLLFWIVHIAVLSLLPPVSIFLSIFFVRDERHRSSVHKKTLQSRQPINSYYSIVELANLGPGGFPCLSSTFVAPSSPLGALDLHLNHPIFQSSTPRQPLLKKIVQGKAALYKYQGRPRLEDSLVSLYPHTSLTTLCIYAPPAILPSTTTLYSYHTLKPLSLTTLPSLHNHGSQVFLHLPRRCHLGCLRHPHPSG